MRMYDLIEKKKSGETLSDEEIKWMIDGYTTGNIPELTAIQKHLN